MLTYLSLAPHTGADRRETVSKRDYFLILAFSVSFGIFVYVAVV
jgi:hypothetical protein